MKKNKGLIIVILYFVILITANIYCRTEYDNLNNENQALIITSKFNPSNLINNAEGIVSQKRALTFYPGEDNDIIYSPKVIINSDGSQSYENVDKTKLLWQDLLADNNIIYTHSASDCNTSLNKDEIILQLHWVDESSSKITNVINKEIVFKHNETLIHLKVKEIKEADIYNHICIADELYNELLETEENYVYALRFDKYKNFQNTEENLRNSTDEETLHISVPSKSQDTSNKKGILGDIIDALSILNIISIVILAIIIVTIIVDIFNKKLNKTE